MDGGLLPIYGDDPRSNTGKKVFFRHGADARARRPAGISRCAARGYLYVILGGRRVHVGLAADGQSQTLRASAWGVLVLIALGLAAALLIVRGSETAGWLRARWPHFARAGSPRRRRWRSPLVHQCDEIDILAGRSAK